MLQTVVVRLGALLVLMLAVGRWADVLHIVVCFLGEASCLIPTQDLLDAVLHVSAVDTHSVLVCFFIESLKNLSFSGCLLVYGYE